MRTFASPPEPRRFHGFGAVAVVLCLAFTARAQAPGAVAPATNAASNASGSAPVAPPSNLTLPVLTYQEPAIYPPEAEQQGLEGSVLLSLTIEKDGSVSKVDVVEPAGHGFDEAAQAAAQKFRFTPAMQNGVPVRVKIPYRQSFVKPVAPKAPEPVLPTVGDLDGRLLLAGAEVPLAGITIVATAANGNALNVTSDADGKWSFVGLTPGIYKIEIQATGFVRAQFDEEVIAGKETVATYRLAPESGGIEVTVSGQRPPREVTRRTIERREIARVPGTGGDALRSLQSLPGVARPPGLAGLLIVRGSAPEDTETFVDGIGVPLIYHFGGLSSVVPTELLDKIDFYPGNFSARYGRVMGGIVEVGLRAPNTQCTGDYGKPLDKYNCYHGMFEFDLIDTRAMFQGPIGTSKEWSFAVAGRRSWVDTWLSPTLKAAGAGVTSAPVYYDYQMIAEYHPRKDERLSLRFYGSDDRLELIIKDPLAEDPGFVGGNLNYRTGFYRAQALYDVSLTRNVDLETTVSVGEDRIHFSLGQLAFNVTANVVLTRSELQFKLTKGLKLDLGLDYNAAPYDLLVRAPEPPRPGEASAGPFTTRPVLEHRDHGLAFRPGWYGEAEVKPSRALLIVPGLRIDYARDSGHADLSPRINARYDLVGGGNVDPDAPDKPRRTTLKAGFGVFDQPPQFQETDTVFGTPGIESNRSIHYTVGVEQELTDQVEVSVEGYYKDLGNLVSRTPDENGEYVYNNAGTGYVIGAETLLKYKPDSRFFGWIAYTLSRSLRKNGPGEPSYLFQYDQTHILTLLGSYRLGRGWEAGARFRLVSGPLATPVQGSPGLPALYAADAAAYTPLEGGQFSKRLPLFHQLDIRIDKSWQFRDWRLSAFLDIWNAYNNPAVEALGYNFDFSQQSYSTGLPIIPSLGMRGEF